MSQATTGIRSLSSIPFIYEIVQRLMGAKNAREKFVKRFIEPFPSDAILDIGCGPAAILDYLHSVNYYGYDINKASIEKARQAYGSRGKFFAKALTLDDLDDMPKFDIVLLTGVLHHLDDESAIDILKMAFKALKPNGRLITTDGCYVQGDRSITSELC